GYALCDNYREMFLDVANSEYIYAKEFSETYSHALGFNLACTGDGGRGWSTPSQNLVDAYETLEGEIPVLNSKSGEVNPNSMYNPEKPYENRDPRFYDCVYYNGSTTKDDRIVETFQGGADMLNQDMTMTSYYLRKFVNEKEPISQSHHYTTPFPFFRLAEIYLNYAEAEYHLGNEDIAREYVNKVRARKSVNMPPITESRDALLKRIYHERQIELAFEGHRYFDLRRWKIADNAPIIGFKITKNGTNDYTYERYTLSLTSRESDWKNAFFVLPIHYQEIQKSNNSLEQNPGY
ncbi:RagB/SusD family nutrient uptake outer membrane protein, partial [uncultured Parabacteroides sp.]